MKANRIKWIVDKSKNFRGNFEPMCFKLDNSNYIFCFNAYMSYKCFKSKVREVAQAFNSKVVEIMEEYQNGKQISNMIIVTGLEEYKFRIELDVPEGARRQFKWYNVNEIFNI
jgi:hypothetical protein